MENLTKKQDRVLKYVKIYGKSWLSANSKRDL